MIRATFKTKSQDYRPTNWPIKHPYWCTGSGFSNDDESYSTIVAYADNADEIIKNWPEAYGIDAEEAEDYKFTSRFKNPGWFDNTPFIKEETL